MALTLVQIDALAHDVTFRARVRAACAYESAERNVTLTYVSNQIMAALVEDGPTIQEWCWRSAYGLKGQADSANITDPAIKSAVSVVMDRIYPIVP